MTSLCRNLNSKTWRSIFGEMYRSLSTHGISEGFKCKSGLYRGGSWQEGELVHNCLCADLHGVIGLGTTSYPGIGNRCWIGISTSWCITLSVAILMNWLTLLFVQCICITPRVPRIVFPSRKTCFFALDLLNMLNHVDLMNPENYWGVL